MIFEAFFKGEYARYAWSMSLALICSIAFEAWLLTEVNVFYGSFWDAINGHDGPTAWSVFLPQQWTYDGTFVWMAGLLVVNGTLLSYFSNKWGFWWRQSIVEEYIPRYLKVNKDVEGASQRIQEDTYKFARYVRDLGRGAFKAIFVLLLFIPLLWELSALEIANWPVGYFVWIALAMSLGGILISAIVARKLPGLEYNNQVVEAKFRKQLVQLEDDRTLFTNKTLQETFADIRFNYFKLFNNYAGFALWARIYWQSAVFIPLIFALPQYFAVKFSVGILHQIMNSFDKVQESFSYLVDNWTQITELQSVNKRLNEFEAEIYKR